ncbi:APC family permease [Corynebacterium sp.]|uniref:APC family permease n=1 Tax=Corynebacterium sp. TaxID=1720 RepID=UPI0026DD2267|nr:APC family permease [Corynebacterium sp.]MDO5032666.1 APC family permease [Corynebacterium sp.]
MVSQLSSRTEPSTAQNVQPGHQASTNHEAGLGAGRLGTASLVFMIIAASAPLTVLAGGVPTNFAVSGLLGVPWGYLVLGLILVFFAVGYGIMSSQIQNSGAFYAYVSEGLGNRQGIAAAILALVSYNMMQVGLYGIFGFSLANLINGWCGTHIAWWVAALGGWLLVAVMGVRNVDFSAKVLGILVALEFIVVAAVSVLSLGVAPEGITAETLKPDQFFTGGIGVVLAFGIAAFMGFESGAIYSEEARDPERTVPKATYISVGVIALFYAFSAWAFAQGVGPSTILAQSQELGPDLVFVWLGGYSSVAANIANCLFITSLLAALVAFHNAAARYFFSLGRSRVLPRVFAGASSSGAPVAGSVAQTVIALVVVVGFAVAGRGSEMGELFPVLTLFTWLTNAAAFGLVFLLAVVSIAIMVWLNRTARQRGIFVRFIAPIVAAIGLAAVFVLVMVNFPLMIGDTGPDALVWVMPGIIIASGVLGLAWAEWLKRRRPEIYTSLHSNLDQI